MPVTYKDYYQTLGVARDASDDDIKKAFRKLAREYHPDVAKNKKQAEEKFKEINEAYEVLGDPAKRKKYDELGENWRSGSEFRPPPGWESHGGQRGYRTTGAGGQDFEFQFGGTGFSDFFEQLFGSRGRGRAGGFHAPGGFTEEDHDAQRGGDLEGDIMVTLEEAAHGSVRAVSVRTTGICDNCHGTGLKARATCHVCAGSGRVPRHETYQVKIPAGVTEGQRLRIPGRGQAGHAGGTPGDLYLRVRLARHPDFEVEGHNLVHTLDLTPWEAVLGAQISVPTLAGHVSIRIPPGTQNGQKLRVRGRGLANHAGQTGDLIVVARIEVPSKISEQERRLWEDLAAQSRFSPR